MTTFPSYVCGSKDVPLLDETIGEFLDRIAVQFDDAPALISPSQGLRWSYKEFRSATDRIASGLSLIGLVKGDRIGIWSANRAEWILTQFAAARLGLILVTVNPAYRVHEAEHALKLAGCKAVVAQNSYKKSNYHAILLELTRGANGNRLTELKHVISLDETTVPGWLNWADLERLGATAVADRNIRPFPQTHCDEAINIQFTSGTTGAPKGATLSHRNILNNGYFVGETLRLTRRDRLCLCVPLYHCFGLVMGVIGAFTHGACVVLAGEGFDPAVTLDTTSQEQCTVLYGVPAMFVSLLEEQSRSARNTASLRTGIMAGAPCPETVMRGVMNVLGMPEVTIAYGMTETSPVSFQSQIDDSVAFRVATVGRVHPHVEVKVVDSAGQVVSRGLPGELLTRGYSVMLGYWNDPQRTLEAIDRDGWMHTGDLATLDDEGYCRIVGRLKDMLIRGGENIYPREIEELLFNHQDIAEVQVFGVPDPRYGEEVCAWIRLKPDHTATAESLREWCRDRISHYKVPRYIEFVETFPTTISGKAQKHLMREAMARRMGQSEQT
ncbi:MAG: AMP-binding protein [Burkholderiales bacterium]